MAPDIALRHADARTRIATYLNDDVARRAREQRQTVERLRRRAAGEALT
jgi:hypothetical protein